MGGMALLREACFCYSSILPREAEVSQEGKMMQSSTALEVVLKRDRLIVLGGLAGITALAWAYTGYLAWSMDCMHMAMPHMQTWDVIDLILLCIMWVVMMVAMMVPSAAPMMLMYTTIN